MSFFNAKDLSELSSNIILIEATIYLADSLIALCVAFVIPVVLSLSSNQPFTEILLLFSAIAALLVLRFFLARTKAETANEGSVLIKENLRCRLLGKLFELGPAFTAHERTGDIVDTISNKVESLSKYYTYYFPVCIGVLINSTVLLAVLLTIDTALCRSEERRVGKECRSRWSPYH